MRFCLEADSGEAAFPSARAEQMLAVVARRAVLAAVDVGREVDVEGLVADAAPDASTELVSDLEHDDALAWQDAGVFANVPMTYPPPSDTVFSKSDPSGRPSTSSGADASELMLQ